MADAAWLETVVLPIAGALIAGGMIGFEREWRGRPAGFRTHILVSLASCLLMLAAMTQADWAFRALPDENIVTDPTRMAHGVLTGIGFLCAGVIFRTGFSIHGLTTAASLWITSAIGLLFGAGLFALGAAGTVITGLILVALRLVSARLPDRTLTDVVTEAWGVWVQKKLYGREYMGIERATFLIDSQGAVRRAWRNVKVKGHAEEVLAAVEAL